MSKSSSSGGISFCGLLTIVFITLKLTGHIDWSWWWVWSPFWLPVAVLLGGGFALAILAAVGLGVIHSFQQYQMKKRLHGLRKKTP